MTIALAYYQGIEVFGGCIEVDLNGVDREVVGIGAQNTTDIIAGCMEVDIATTLCRKEGAAWFLLSKVELILIYPI